MMALMSSVIVLGLHCMFYFLFANERVSLYLLHFYFIDYVIIFLGHGSLVHCLDVRMPPLPRTYACAKSCITFCCSDCLMYLNCSIQYPIALVI